MVQWVLCLVVAWPARYYSSVAYRLAECLRYHLHRHIPAPRHDDEQPIVVVRHRSLLRITAVLLAFVKASTGGPDTRQAGRCARYLDVRRIDDLQRDEIDDAASGPAGRKDRRSVRLVSFEIVRTVSLNLDISSRDPALSVRLPSVTARITCCPARCGAPARQVRAQEVLSSIPGAPCNRLFDRERFHAISSQRIRAGRSGDC